MSIKTILVHLADHDDQVEKRLEVAHKMAQIFDAHITAIFIPTPQVRRGIGRGASSSYVKELAEAALNKGNALQELFERKCSEAKVSHRFVVETGDDYDILATHARAADLLVVSQPKGQSFEDKFRHMLPEELVIMSGVPVMMVPRDWDISESRRHVMIAWKSNRESVRAVRDSMDFLKQAYKVTILTVGSAEETGRLPAEQLQTYLARHNVKADIRRDFEERGDVGQVLRNQAKDMGADLIVMGAYGKKKWFKRVFGTTTSSMTRNAKIPVVFSH